MNDIMSDQQLVLLSWIIEWAAAGKKEQLVPWLAKQTGRQQSSLYRSLHGMERKGHVTWQRYNGQDTFKVNDYSLMLCIGWQGSHPNWRDLPRHMK